MYYVSRFGVPDIDSTSVVVLLTTPLSTRSLDLVFAHHRGRGCDFGFFGSSADASARLVYWCCPCLFSYSGVVDSTPSFIAFNLSSRMLYRRCGFNMSVENSKPALVSCLHELVMANVRPFIGVF